jgi:hypothetical protein
MVAALASSIGLHWMLLQSVAWTTMLAANLRSGSLQAAVQQTFDGKHPCCLCKAIANAKQGEKKNDFPAPVQKLDVILNRSIFVFNHPQLFWELSPRPDFNRARAQKPPVPPPRGLHA